MIKGQEYEYILGLDKRNRKVIGHLLEKVVKNLDDPLLEFGYSDLSPVLQKKYPKEIRFIAGYNKEAVRKTRRKRDINIALFLKLIGEAELEGDLKTVKKSNDRLKLFLSKKHMTRLYNLNMEKITRAFRIVEDEFAIRPIFVRKETRIRGHVMISYFSLLIETLMEKKVEEIFPQKQTIV